MTIIPKLIFDIANKMRNVKTETLESEFQSVEETIEETIEETVEETVHGTIFDNLDAGIAFIDYNTTIRPKYFGIFNGPNRRKYMTRYMDFKRLVSLLAASRYCAMSDYVYIINYFGRRIIIRRIFSHSVQTAAVFIPPIGLIVVGHVMYTATKIYRIKKIGMLLYNTGRFIFKCESRVADIPFMLLDLLLFGEFVPMIDESNFYIKDETTTNYLGNRCGAIFENTIKFKNEIKIENPPLDMISQCCNMAEFTNEVDIGDGTIYLFDKVSELAIKYDNPIE
jgi:hypothetical protein